PPPPLPAYCVPFPWPSWTSSRSKRLPDQGHHLRSVELDAPHQVRVRQRAVAVLHVESGEPKRRHDIDDLGGDSLRRSDEQGAFRTGGGVELCARHWRPPAFSADSRMEGRVVGPQLLARLLV